MNKGQFLSQAENDKRKHRAAKFLNKFKHPLQLSMLWYHRISTIVGYLIPNPVFTYILNIYDL